MFAALVAMNMMEGTLVQIRANGRYGYQRCGSRLSLQHQRRIVTGDGMGMAKPFRCVTWNSFSITQPVCEVSGILMTEGRGEGGILVNKNGYRYLQDYGMGRNSLGEPKTNIWNWVHATKFLRPSGTNGVKHHLHAAW